MPESKLWAHVSEPPPRASDGGAPQAFDAIIATAMAKQPSDRHQSAAAFAAAIHAAAGTTETQAGDAVAAARETLRGPEAEALLDRIARAAERVQELRGAVGEEPPERIRQRLAEIRAGHEPGKADRVDALARRLAAQQRAQAQLEALSTRLDRVLAELDGACRRVRGGAAPELAALGHAARRAGARGGMTAPHRSTPAELQARLHAERRGVPFLVLHDGAGRQLIHELAPGTLTVGRSADCDLSLGWDREVSRLHAQLEATGGRWVLVDDGLSRNGSFVNGERVVGRRVLRDGDRLVFGETPVVYRAAPQRRQLDGGRAREPGGDAAHADAAARSSSRCAGRSASRRSPRPPRTARSPRRCTSASTP